MNASQCSGCTPGCWMCTSNWTRMVTNPGLPPPYTFTPSTASVEQKLDEVIALLKQLLEARK